MIPAPRAPSYQETGWPLVARAQAGDRDAFGQLYATHNPAVLAYIRHRLAPLRRTGDAEDIAQAVWERALRHLPELRWQGVSVEAWLCTVARNLVYDLGKSHAHRFTRAVPAEDIAQALPAVPAVDDLVTLAELARTVRAAVAQLPDTQREVLELRFYCGLSVRETADALGIDDAAVKGRQYRASLQLRQLAVLADLR